MLSGYFITPIRDSSRAYVVSERSVLKYSVRHKVLRERRSKEVSCGQVLNAFGDVKKNKKSQAKMSFGKNVISGAGTETCPYECM